MWQISTADGTTVPKFRPHKRVGNSYTLIDNKPITSITSAELLNGTHRLSITVDGSTITTKLDGTQIDQRTDATFTKGFIGFRQDFANNVDETADVKAVKVTAKNGDVLLDTDFSAGNPFNGGTVTPDGLRVGDRKDVLLKTNDSNKPLLRKEFATDPGKEDQVGAGIRLGARRLRAAAQRREGRGPVPRARIDRLPQAHPVPDVRRDRPGQRRAPTPSAPRSATGGGPARSACGARGCSAPAWG